MGGWVQPPPPSGGAGFSEAPEPPKKIVGPKEFALNKIIDWPMARKKIWPNLLRVGGWSAPPPPPPGYIVVKRSPGGNVGSWPPVLLHPPSPQNWRAAEGGVSCPMAWPPYYVCVG